ncbi:GNVR domain-containing protein [Hyphomicrobium sp. CS1GBMeth3]|uniref:GumC family protein n=1 Tax=Hyphomicrobium sp. CS1GBMeth3 TaxID=1892845 RepID=UPI000931FE4D|nr:GNVR domain-containing protein [Hyphomicrobium sp. CS1GBMeth3]
MLDGDNSAPEHKRRHTDIYNTFGHLSIADVFDFVRRHLQLLAVTTSTAIGLALLYGLFATPHYTAYGQLLIDARVPHLANEQWTETGLVLDTAQVESQAAVLWSEHIARAVVQRLDLLEDPEFGGAPGLTPKAPEGDEAASEAAAAKIDPDLLRRIATQVQGHLDIRRVGLSYVLEVAFTSRDPEKAADIANAIMQSYISDQISQRAEAARQGSQWLERRINTLRLQMNAASLKVQEFKARRDYSIVGHSTLDGDAPVDGNAPADAGPAPTKGFTETLDELESTALTYRKMFESALQAFTEAEQRQSYPVSNSRIISTATKPLYRSSPKRMRALAIATVAGLLLGLGLALLQEGMTFGRRKPQAGQRA